MLRRLPVQVALAALLVYLGTLSHGVTLASLPLTAQLAGWDWQPMSSQPLLWLLTLPLRVLPAGWIALALNLFSAGCAALILGLLARSLELAVWDRPLATLKPWTARLPILFACLLCGLEFNFWQEATAATGEMLQLLLLAVAVWCLLEYRVTREFRWLLTATFIWGIGLAENWMLLLTLPFFIAALFWLGKFSILKKKLLVRLTLAGLAGFSIFAILPLANGLWPHSPWSLGEAWLNTLKHFKHLLTGLYGEFWRSHRMVSLAILMFFLVPVLPFLVRMRDEGLENKSVTDQFQTWIYRALRVGLLLVCLWLAFDPVVGPRQLALKQMNLSLPLLSLDYLAALGGGFLAGNLLLALLAAHQSEYRRPGFDKKFLRPATLPVAVGLLLCVTLGLIYRNASAVTLANRQPLTQFGELAWHILPPDGGSVFSDEPQRLLAFQAATAAHGADKKWLAVDTGALPLPAYRRWLVARHPGDWLTDPAHGELKPPDMMRLVETLARNGPIYYLHPSFGLFFDSFYLRPTGSVYALAAFTDKSVNPPPLTADEILQTEKFWDAALAKAQPETPLSPKTVFARLEKSLYAKLHFQPVASAQNRLLQDWYALALDDWGVQLQRHGKPAAAQKRFVQALALDENNSAARINLQCNTNLAAGNKLNLAATDMLAGQLGGFQKLSQFHARFGPVDEPAFCYLLGNAFEKIGLPRQGLQQFQRAAELAPDILAPKIALAELYSRCGSEAEARKIINQMRTEISAQPNPNLAVGLSLLEANSWLLQTNATKATGVLQSVLKAHPGDAHITDMVLRAYLAFGDYANALQIVNAQVAQNPTNIAGLVNQSGLYLRLGDPTNALAILDRALTLADAPPVRLARALARTEAGQFAAAEADYLVLKMTGTNNLVVYCGLAEIARRKKDNPAAIEFLERCLAELSPEDPQRAGISARIQALKLSASAAGISH